MAVDDLAWLRRHAFDVVIAAFGAAALACGVLSLFLFRVYPLATWLIFSAIILGVVAFACIAASGFLEVSRQIRKGRRWK